MKKSDYVIKLDTLIDDGIMKRTITISELSMQKLYNYESYKDEN